MNTVMRVSPKAGSLPYPVQVGDEQEFGDKPTESGIDIFQIKSRTEETAITNHES
jgi:hypothetical protein